MEKVPINREIADCRAGLLRVEVDELVVVGVSRNIPVGHIREVITMNRATSDRRVALPRPNLRSNFDVGHPVVVHVHPSIYAFVGHEHAVE